MQRFPWRVLAGGFLVLAVGAALAPAMELGRILPPVRRCPPAWQGNPRAISPPGQSAVSPQGQSAGIPGPHRYPEYNQSSPWYGYGFGVPTYSWGYFGATYRPAVITHRGYYGDFYQWGYRRGY